MKTFVSILLASATLCLGGCFSLDTTVSSETQERHIVVSNFGWRLFYFIPLCCGNASSPDPNRSPFAFFRDDMQMDIIQKRFMEHVAGDKDKVEDLTYITNESVLFNIPFLQIPFPIPYILCYREVQLSGVIR